MKLDKRTTEQIGSIQDRIHTVIERLKTVKYHNDMYENSYYTDTEDEISVIAQLYSASASLEMILERIDIP